ncbi:MAG: hypothetical protein A3F26_01505 [Candidatus Ryanbacteria bacterium RIFCSPHIGHO2_12_FULL_47_12b]|uniref:PDZ domain-containing protein n=3 Tax=Parcubacteria group TaxID=1794811 RepID=A0A1G2H5G9_9BACT|nr:MAG: Membrane-associated zinc metalloprotease [Parcubacteria group bacterium GW2011_GWA2_47_10b]KKU75995.1 MAG: Membrane-associated zinc metalloprotease [Candidatus Giovannonibacteria bacterium GW2011_GWB1_47_6b]KKU85945.1 MAG: Membrane-associated zinc metalloprotease [Parcubacteria group bacterium GW2011_GWA1_47_9]OGZ47468.1 MAG: hypothetical protein A2844_00555 [Candidatus Ryanbacteria bacterium RIFCSPHIGHO2_01_FULL_48_80]OGZ49494.1 MAG: hypothetical protein A3C83_02335 [Candidatus Ryanbac
MGIIEGILVFVAVILLLVVSHEFGHFFAARFFKVRVEEFGVGIPPRLFGFRWKETFWTINALPLGGFVKIFGEEEDINDPQSFSARSYLVKSLIVSAGVIANILTAFVLLTIIVGFGIPQFTTELSAIQKGSPAEEVGMRAGDKIVNLDNHSTSAPLTVEDVQKYIAANVGTKVVIIVERNGDKIPFTLVPRRNPPEGEGALGIVFDISIQRVPWYQIPWEGLKATYAGLQVIVAGLLFFFFQLFTTGTTPGDIVGPVGIAVIATETYRFGFIAFLQLVALLSLNLAVINILPIPALDGGRIFFFVIEKIRGKVIPARVAGLIHSIFFIALIVLLLWISWHDVINLKRYAEIFG